MHCPYFIARSESVWPLSFFESTRLTLASIVNQSQAGWQIQFIWPFFILVYSPSICSGPRYIYLIQLLGRKSVILTPKSLDNHSHLLHVNSMGDKINPCTAPLYLCHRTEQKLPSITWKWLAMKKQSQQSIRPTTSNPSSHSRKKTWWLLNTITHGSPK